MNIQTQIPEATMSLKADISHIRDSLAQAQYVLLDWDGCVALGDVPSAEAVAFIEAWTDRVAIVSNNSTRLPEDIAHILARAGASIPESRIVLAGTEAIARACEMRAKRVMILGEGRLKAYGRKLGLNIVNSDADLVVVLRDTRFSYARLYRAVNSLKAGAKLIIANPDLSHPGPRGCIVPETGALVAALMACLDASEVPTEVIGKPSWRLFSRACQSLGASRENTLMIGDNPRTDMAGASAYGLRGLLVGANPKQWFADILCL